MPSSVWKPQACLGWSQAPPDSYCQPWPWLCQPWAPGFLHSLTGWSWEDSTITRAEHCQKVAPFEPRQQVPESPLWLWLWLPGRLGICGHRAAPQESGRGVTVILVSSVGSELLKPDHRQHEWHLICFYGFLIHEYIFKSLPRKNVI